MSSDYEEYNTDEESAAIGQSTTARSGRSSMSSRRSQDTGRNRYSNVTIEESGSGSDEESLGAVGLRNSGRSGRRSMDSRRSENTGSSRYSNVVQSESGSDDEIVRMPTRNKQAGRGRRVAAIESETEDEDELDQRGLSPRTRMSITGVRPQDLSGDSSEIDYSDEEQHIENSDGSAQQPSGAESFNEDVDPEEAAAERFRQAIGEDPPSPRYSTQFADNIEETLHSTIFPVGRQQNSPKSKSNSMSNSSSSDVLILSNRETPIEISSTTEDEDSINKENVIRSSVESRKSRSYSPRSSAGAPTVRSTKNLIQPTINGAIKKISPRRSSTKGGNVSVGIYEKELRKLAEMRAQCVETSKLYERVAHKLPDKGSQILQRIAALQQDIDIKTKYLENVKVEKDLPQIKVTQPRVIKPGIAANDAPDWDDLSAAVNKIQPLHTGSQGLATFNAQKALTMESLKDLHGSLKGCPAEHVLADDPAGLKVPLMDHQKHALAWMTWREKQRPRGGILADDMGLGKTLTMISMVLSSKNQTDNISENKSASSDEDEEKTTGGWNSKGRKQTYNGGTLVICPASLLRQWENEVVTKLSRNRLTVLVHHGANRETRPKSLRTYDIVVTTYNIVSREYKQQDALYGVKWRRIILDEAHVVRNHKSQSSMSVCELRAKYRWTLTGTPIQNKELDVYALLKFLRCSPFDDLATWKRWIDNKSAGGQERLNLLMKSLMLRRTKAQLQLDGKLNSLPKKEIILVQMNLDTDEMNVYQRVMTYSRTLFAQFLFQRAEKDSDANYLQEAGKPTYNQIKDPNGAYYKMHEKFSRMAGHSKEVKSHEILVLLLRLRQICCHPGLIDSMLDEENSGNVDGDESDGNTPEIDLLAQLNKMTINDSSNSSRNSGSRHSSSGDGNNDKNTKAAKNVLKRSNPVFNLSRPSSKILKVLEILKKYVLKTNDKAIVVSQWTSVLNILQSQLDKERLATLSLNGTIPVHKRQNIVNEFNDPHNSKRILLLSLTAGGVGLNLVGANHLILLDLHWNPQLEAQAQDRIYRVGQKKNVFIYKMVCQDTVEERIKALQDRKLELAEGVLTGKVSTKLSIDDLKGLFGM